MKKLIVFMLALLMIAPAFSSATLYNAYAPPVPSWAPHDTHHSYSPYYQSAVYRQSIYYGQQREAQRVQNSFTMPRPTYQYSTHPQAYAYSHSSYGSYNPYFR